MTAEHDPDEGSVAWDVILFFLILIGIVWHKQRKAADEDF